MEEFGDEASDTKKRNEFIAAACSSTIFATKFATEDSRVTIINDDSEKDGGGALGENKRPEHEV